MSKRCRKIWLSIGIFLLLGRISLASEVEFLTDLRTKLSQQRHAKIPQLKDTYRGSSEPMQRLIAALALSAHHLRKQQLKLSLQYVSAADALARDVGAKASSMRQIVSIQRAKIEFASKAYRVVVERVRPLKGRKLGPWQVDAFQLLLSSYYELGQDTTFHKLYRQYLVRTPRGIQLRRIDKMAALVYQRLKMRKQEHTALERLAMDYPTTEASRWAFVRLNEYSCLKHDGRYIYGERLLKRFSINRDLDIGLREFLASRVESPIRLRRGVKHRLSKLEKVDMLLKWNLFEDAGRFEGDLIEIARVRSQNKQMREALRLLARVYSGLKNYPASIRKYVEFINRYPKDRNIKKVRNDLAAVYHRNRQYVEAAMTYEDLARKYHSRRYRWEHFWNTYLAGNYQDALFLLERKKYVYAKDRTAPLAPLYWKGRVLEKLGRDDEAKSVYEQVLSKNAHSYYANLVLTLHSDLWEKSQSELESHYASDGHTDESGVRLASLMIDGASTAKPATSSSTLEIINELHEVGLHRMARLKLKALPFSRYSNENDIQFLGRLAWALDDYRSSRQLVSRSNFSVSSSMDLYALKKHQKDNQDEWRVIYPLAYKPILEPVADYYELDKLLVLSIMRAESRYSSDAKSHVGATGLLQIMPKTSIRISKLMKDKSFQLEDLQDPITNLVYGGHYLRRLLDQYGNNVFVAVGAYNAGPFAMNRWLGGCQKCDVDELIESISYRETRRYVKEVIRYYGQYSKIYRKDQPFWTLPSLPTDLPREDQLF